MYITIFIQRRHTGMVLNGRSVWKLRVGLQWGSECKVKWCGVKCLFVMYRESTEVCLIIHLYYTKESVKIKETAVKAYWLRFVELMIGLIWSIGIHVCMYIYIHPVLSTIDFYTHLLLSYHQSQGRVQYQVHNIDLPEAFHQTVLWMAVTCGLVCYPECQHFT